MKIQQTLSHNIIFEALATIISLYNF